MRASRLVLPAALAGVAGGILAADALVIPIVPLALGGAGLTGIALLVGKRGGAVALLGIVVAALALGALRGDEAARPLEGPSSLATLVDGDEHDLIGTIVDDPRPRENRLQLVLANVVTEKAERPERLSDRLLVWLPRGIDARAGDRLRIASELEIAEDVDGFAYRNDLVPEPEAALGAGILLGVRVSIAPEINDAFATAGLTHVVAISGWNIAIVAALVAAAVRPLARRPGGRWTTAALAALAVGGYVLLTGASPSVVRAALMAAAMLVARLGGSRAHAASALALAALVMLLADPQVLWDVGFQLSLLAPAGLV